ncbi:hypothetical protein MBLNU459_g6697t2 [Dothideomycetes sp. NU459]
MDSDLDPNTFLQSVRELKEKRQKEDNERYEQLEAQIMQDRESRLARKLGGWRERDARREAPADAVPSAERERSLSPDKTPQSARASRSMTPSHASPVSATPPLSPPPRERTPFDRPPPSFAPSQREGRESPAPAERPLSPSKASPSAAMPSRSNTMSWQRRPTSSSRNRPLSALASENSAARSPHRTPEPRTEEREAREAKEPSRESIAESLASKDPTWFKQTADRGRSSPAYRTSRDEATQESAILRRQLPGMAREMPVDAPSGTTPRPESTHSTSPPRAGSVRGSSAWSSRPSSAVSTLEQRKSDTRSPLPFLDSQKFAAPASESASSAGAESTAPSRTMSNAQSRISMDRPPSPTKGMGGFVQSAMLKRNDSVNKRWSAQPGASLTRQDSTASIRSGIGSVRDGYSSMAASRSMPRLDTASGTESQSRPGSSHSTISNLALGQDSEARFAKPSLPAHSHSRSKSVASVREAHTVDPIPEGLASPPLSPSKRWSPTKASWLESALARPESPKPALQSNQPSWMAEISKAKQQRSSGESTLSQDNLDAAKAQDSANFGPNLLKRASLRDPTNSATSTRNVTPPTKTKPAALSVRSAVTETPLRGPEVEPELLRSKPEAHASNYVKRETADAVAEAETAKPLDTKPSALSSPFASPNPEAVQSPGFLSALSPKPLSVPTQKPKPEAPPKKDFRAGLKPRSDLSDIATKEEPEFRSMFGKLKKAQPERYVAPDELKGNILRGKAGLSLTAGPQKTERRDELKESLLQKKEEMKTKASDVKPEPKGSPAPASDLPEALRIKKQLGRSNSTLNVALPERQRRDVTPEALSLHKSLRGKPRALSPEKRSSVTQRPEADEPISYRNLLQKSSSTPNPSHEQLDAAPQKIESKPATSNKFADKFNPALAGLLARGPPSASSNPATPRSASPISYAARAPSSSTAAVEGPETGGELTHMTKNRAKGPKRRKPNAKSSERATASKARASDVAAPSATVDDVALNSLTPRTPVKPAPKSATVRAVSIHLSAKQQPEAEKPSTSTPTKPASSVPSSDTKSVFSDSTSSVKTPSKAKPLPAPRVLSSSIQQTPGKGDLPAPSVTPAATVESEHRASTVALSSADSADADKENASSVKSAASVWGRQTPRTVSQTRNKPIDLPTRKDEEAALRSAGLLSTPPARNPKPPTLGLGISQSSHNESPKRLGNGEFPSSPPTTGGLPPRPAKSSRIVSGALRDSSDIKDLLRVPGSERSKAGRGLAAFFGEVPVSTTQLQVDTQAIITSRPGDVGKVRTLRKAIQEISGDGKLSPLPAHEEHILYEDSMYVCTHVFGSAGGTKTVEVYLWAGCGVPESTIQDAQLVAKNIAKEAGAGQRSTALFVVDQTREPSLFFEALGGIVIVRRGSRGGSSLRPYMLCGRPHMGHIAFDEVDLSMSSLCSDFPYIIVCPTTLQEAKVYLWKGSASGADAVGSARLLGMDLSPAGNIIEVEEGKENEVLLDVLGHSGSGICKSPELWSRTKKTWDRSTARLFRLDPALPKQGATSLFTSFLGRRPSWTASGNSSPNRPQSSASNNGADTPVLIKEIAPFTQTDLEPEGCYVMDCGPTVIVLPGPLLAKQQNYSQAFTQALLFAHDYAILSASLEDRPAIPVASVALSGLPREAKMRFRRWDTMRGVWGAGGIMAGRNRDAEESTDLMDIRDALEVCCGY